MIVEFTKDYKFAGTWYKKGDRLYTNRAVGEMLARRNVAKPPTIDSSTFDDLGHLKREEMIYRLVSDGYTVHHRLGIDKVRKMYKEVYNGS